MQELSSIFHELAKIKASSEKDMKCKDFEVTHDCITALKNSLKENPVHVSLLLSKLCLSNHKEFNLNSVFSHMFFQLLLNSLKSAESFAYKKENEQLFINLTDRIYLLLSLLYHFTFDQQVKELENIFLYCLDLCELGILKLDKIYLALLGNSSLLKYFFKLEDCKLLSKESTSEDCQLPNSNFFINSGNFHHRGALMWSVNNNTHFLQHFMVSFLCIL